MERSSLCDGCGKSTPVSDLRYCTKGNDLFVVLCSECRNKGAFKKGVFKKKEDVFNKKGGSIAKETHVLSRTQHSASAKKPVQEEKVKLTYICGLCKYKFKSEPRSMIKCPYCGESKGVREYRKMPSAELLRSVDDE